jgi:hypothetical protein
MNNYVIEKLTSERIALPNVNTLLKISLGLILFTIISFALVYAETIPVDVAGTTYDVEYTATGITVSAIEADSESFSLILSVEANSVGTLDIVLDRSLIDSLYDDNGVVLDDAFFILADDDYTDFEETMTTSQSRTLSVTVPSGTSDIEIIGTVIGSPVIEEPVVEEPVIEEPPVVEDKPVVTPPKVEDKPVVTPPKVEDKPVVTTPKVQCGPGTILKDGACVLDERCGPGTVLKDGACVIDSTPKPTETSVKGMGKELLMGVIAAFIVAGTVGLILGIMSKASKSS